MVRESPFSRSIQDHNPACTESHTLVPGVDAIHKRPPSALQLVHLLAQLLNLFRQAALCQADPGWDGARDGQRGESGSQRGTKRALELGKVEECPHQGPDDNKEKRRGWQMSRRLTGGPGQKRTLPREDVDSESTPQGQTNARQTEPSSRENQALVTRTAKASGCNSQHVGLFPE